MALAVIAFGGGCGHCVFVKRKFKVIFAHVFLLIFCAAFLMASASDIGLEGVDTTFETTADREETLETAPAGWASSSDRLGSTATLAPAGQTAHQQTGLAGLCAGTPAAEFR